MIGYRQSLFGYNSLKWDKRIEPLRYQEAKKSYVETLELVSANAINKYFALATAQSNYDIVSIIQMPRRSIVTLRGATI